MGFGLIFIWLFVALTGWLVGRAKERGVEGFALGAVLGVIGIIIVALMKPAPRSSRQIMADHRFEHVEQGPVQADLSALPPLPQQRPCPACRAPSRADAPYCWKCGQNFADA